MKFEFKSKIYQADADNDLIECFASQQKVKGPPNPGSGQVVGICQPGETGLRHKLDYDASNSKSDMVKMS
jgi:hypothetical protein